ncbi:MAG: mobile mystery protein B [Deltaproteobacteria bacterium]|nr:mobile mystery protein B [Deltaproteobacteria bacterium]
MKFEYPSGATPLDLSEAAGLIPKYISLQRELNAAEQENIIKAHTWAHAKKHSNLLTIEFLRELHRRMFCDVWTWAGTFRKTDKSVGNIDASEITSELKKLVDDTSFWIKKDTHPGLEICARFHHRLVFIHAFPNGNGRHSRLAADILREQIGGHKLTWGNHLKLSDTEVRARYIADLKAADQGDYSRLIAFVAP